MKSLWGFLCLLTAATACCDAGNYTLVDIADTKTNNLELFSAAPQVNNSGVVVFNATPPPGGNGVYMGSGGAVAQVAGLSEFPNGFTLADINNSGTVAFAAGLSGGAIGLYARNGSTTTTIALSGGVFRSLGDCSINDAGTVAFYAGLTGGGSGIFYGNGGAVTTVVTTTFNGFNGFTSAAAINKAGTVTFLANPATNSIGIYKFSGGALTPVATGPSMVVDVPAINSAGDIVFLGPHAIYKESNGTITTVATVNGSGPFAAFGYYGGVNPANNFGAPGITDDGTVIFAALLNTGAAGIFTGTDPVADRVIATGDPLFGSTLQTLNYFHGVSGDGDVAFGYSLANGVSGIALAVPAPEPSMLNVLLMCPLLARSRNRFRGREEIQRRLASEHQ
jgi:hypothetical protein